MDADDLGAAGTWGADGDVELAIVEMARRLAAVSAATRPFVIERALADLARIAGADQAMVVGIDLAGGELVVRERWPTPTPPRRSVADSRAPLDSVTWLLVALSRVESAIVVDVDDLVERAVLLADLLRGWGAESFVAAPISVGGRLVGCVLLTTETPSAERLRRGAFAVELAAAIISGTSSGQARSQAQVGALPDLMFELDADGAIVDFHAPNPDQLLVAPSEFLGRALGAVFDRAMAEVLEAALERLKEGSPAEVVEYELDLPVGRRSFECRFAPVDGGGALALVRDVTERLQRDRAYFEQSEQLARANEDLARASQLKAELLAVMSHELRTPLTTVLGVAAMLEEGSHGALTGSQLEAVETIETSSMHLLELIDDLLDLGRLEAGMERLDLAPVDVAASGRGVLEVIRERAALKGVRVEFVDESGTGLIMADERRLRQILVNLLDNAVKFTPAGGSVGLRLTSHDPRHLAIAVWDTGIGIERKDQPGLFEAFVQVDHGAGRRHGGMGTGLALVARLVELHGGQVDLESRPGGGSTFTVLLPVESGEQA